MSEGEYTGDWKDLYAEQQEGQAPSFERVEMVPSDLLEFSTWVTGDASTVMESWLQAAGLAAELPYFGGFAEIGGPVQEGHEFQQAYIAAMKAQTRLISDGVRALGALAQASMGIHNSVFNVEALGAGDMSGVWDRYTAVAVEQALTPRLPTGDSGAEEGSGPDLEEEAQGQWGDLLEAEEAAGEEGSGELPVDGLTTQVEPEEAPPANLDVRDEVWDDLEDVGYLGEDREESFEHLPNDGLLPEGHPMYEGLDDE